MVAIPIIQLRYSVTQDTQSARAEYTDKTQNYGIKDCIVAAADSKSK